MCAKLAYLGTVSQPQELVLLYVEMVLLEEQNSVMMAIIVMEMDVMLTALMVIITVALQRILTKTLLQIYVLRHVRLDIMQTHLISPVYSAYIHV